MKTGKMLTFISAVLLTTALAAGEISPPAKDGKDVLSVIHSRKSVRTYLDKPVTQEQWEVLLRAGMAAPTAADRRPWAFVVVTKKETLNAMADTLKYGKMLKNAGGAIVVFGLKERFLKGQDAEMWVQDCSAATENILLAAEGIGLGTVWLGVYPVKERMDAIAKIVGAPENALVLNVISVGWPGGDEKPLDKYNASRVHWEKW